jgi:hypothetical protein
MIKFTDVLLYLLSWAALAGGLVWLIFMGAPS